MSENQDTLTLGRENFEREVLESDLPVLVDFWAAWCGPCRAIAPTIDAIATELRGSAKVGKVDADAEGELLEQHGVTSIPTLVLFKGGREVERIVGAVPKQVLIDKLAALAGAAA